MPGLSGRRVALLESRMNVELASLVSRLGGSPVSAPSVREMPQTDGVGTGIDQLLAHRFSVTIFLTGAGVNALLKEADQRACLRGTIAALSRLTIGCRGPKPLAALKRHGLVADITTVKPHTSRELLVALARAGMSDRDILLVHYGELNPDISDGVRAFGAHVHDICPYVWALPEDVTPVASMIRDAVEGSLDAVLFTSQIQCRHLFEIARRIGLSEELTHTLNADVIVGAVGPICADALRQLGVTPDVIPAAPNMASLITAVSDYFELSERRTNQHPEN